jgi:hypothetical protein
MKPPLEIPPIETLEFRPGQADAGLAGARAVGAGGGFSARSARLDYLLAAVRRRDRRVRRAPLVHR